MQLSGVTSVGSSGSAWPASPWPRVGEGGFARTIDQLLSEANGLNGQAIQQTVDLAVGKTENVHDVMLTVAKADLSFRLILEIRNRLTEALQEILRMPI